MAYENPPVPWREVERALSGKPPSPVGDGNDSPAWTRHRDGYSPPHNLVSYADLLADPDRVPYAELHCHSNFSFLDGASHPEELAEEAVRLGLDALAITDHDGMYGVVRFAEAARELGLPTVFGVELSLNLTGPQNGVADPEGQHLLLLARGPEGYTRLCRTITTGHLTGGEKGRPVYNIEQVAEDVRDHVVVLTGCRKGTVRTALTHHGPTAAADELRVLVDLFGAGNVVVELTDYGLPDDTDRNDLLAALAAELRLPTIATNAVHMHRPARFKLAGALAAVRANRSLDEIAGWLPASSAAHLRSGAEQAARFGRYPGILERTAALGCELAFDLRLVAPKLPPFRVPPGHNEASYLRWLTLAGARNRYGPKAEHPQAYQQIEYELKMISELGFPGYFLVVWDIVRFCREANIFCQGRGSAANSAVCYALGITNADPVRWKLLFERFLTPERDGPPDIDVDIESDRREEVIQYVYATHGRRRAAQVANVITYRPKSAIRDMARALGYAPGQLDAWSKRIDGWAGLRATLDTDDHGIPPLVAELALQVENFPRHLGIHSGGMVLSDVPVSEVVPVEHARMPDRTVLQWDKDDCAAIGLTKFDLLGLGMLSALHYAVDLIAEHHGVRVDLAQLDLADPQVYAMLQRADTIGVFQVESRAQMATLPRLKPREFYDLVVEVALIRPGPIQGGSVHPYIRRRNGDEEPDCGHPLLERALGKTLGVPLFQEQLMQMAMDVADFTPAEADQLRRAMGAKRSSAKMERLRVRLYAGMARNGIVGELADTIFLRLKAFSNYGFPESHALSFAVLVYASAWIKHHHPDAFCAALLRAQPMGFYSPQSLVADARRHGVTVRGVDINLSLAHAILEPFDVTSEARAVRLGLGAIRAIGADLADRVVAERETDGPYTSMVDLARRTRMTTPQLEALATAGAFTGFGMDRRQALWAAGAAARDRPDRLPGTTMGTDAPMLPGMDEIETAVADVWATGISPDSHPIQFLRPRLDKLGVVPITRLSTLEHGERVVVGGAVTHRQRPATAGGITFLNLEDETGMLNVVCTQGVWRRYRQIASSSNAMIIRGALEKVGEVISLRADQLRHLDMRVPGTSRDFR